MSKGKPLTNKIINKSSETDKIHYIVLTLLNCTQYHPDDEYSDYKQDVIVTDIAASFQLPPNVKIIIRSDDGHREYCGVVTESASEVEMLDDAEIDRIEDII